jgi:hypothetical protein
MTIDNDFLHLLLVSNAVLLSIACLAIARFERRCRRLEEFWSSPTGSAMAEDQAGENNEHLLATQRLEKCMGELQRTVKVMEIKSPAQRRSETGTLPLENALRMVKSGASAADLTRSCGLNIGEARLLHKLHGQTSVAMVK